MTKYTPTTEEVRGDYAHFQVPGGTDPVTGEFAEGLAEFDRWLTEYTRAKQAEAWDECGKDIHGNHYPDTETYLRNPYREEKK